MFPPFIIIMSMAMIALLPHIKIMGMAIMILLPHIIKIMSMAIMIFLPHIKSIIVMSKAIMILLPCINYIIIMSMAPMLLLPCINVSGSTEILRENRVWLMMRPIFRFYVRTDSLTRHWISFLACTPHPPLTHTCPS